MTIAKKLFLIATIGLGLGSQLNAQDAQEMRQRIFDFAITLYKENNDYVRPVANWLTKENGITGDYNLLEPISLILNAPASFEEKIKLLLLLKENSEKKAAMAVLNEQQWKEEAKYAQQMRELKNFATAVLVAAILPAVMVISAEKRCPIGALLR